jgi:hypothetical protein
MGHDVRAADEERDLDGMPDEELLALATSDERILVTFNVTDFPGIARRWAEAGQSHTGCAIVVGIGHHEFGTIIWVIDQALESRPDSRDWLDYTCYVARGS